MGISPRPWREGHLASGSEVAKGLGWAVVFIKVGGFWVRPAWESLRLAPKSFLFVPNDSSKEPGWSELSATRRDEALSGGLCSNWVYKPTWLEAEPQPPAGCFSFLAAPAGVMFCWLSISSTYIRRGRSGLQGSSWFPLVSFKIGYFSATQQLPIYGVETALKYGIKWKNTCEYRKVSFLSLLKKATGCHRRCF